MAPVCLAVFILGLAGAAFAVPMLSEELLGSLNGTTFPAPLGAVVVTETLLVVIPAAILRQWCSLAAGGREECRTEPERVYYGVTVAVLATGLLTLWYVFPYRIILSAAGYEGVPRFSSVDEATQFLRELRSWVGEAANWPWLAIPFALLAFPYAGLVARTPAFSRARRADAASRVQAGLAGLLFAMSTILERLVNQAIEALRRAAVLLNRALAAMVRWVVDVAISSADVLLRATAIIAVLGIGGILVVSGVITGNWALVLTGAIMIAALAAAAISGMAKEDNGRGQGPP